MDKQKFITILLILVIVASIFTIVINFSAGASSVKSSSNIILTDPDDSSVSRVGLVVTEKAIRDGGSG